MKNDIKKMIAEELKLLRIKNNFTQSQLSDRCNVDTSTIVRYEKNNVTMQIDTIVKILDAYGINIFIFFESILAKTQKEIEKSKMEGK